MSKIEELSCLLMLSRLALRALLRMDLVRSSLAASQETAAFVKKWWNRLVEASAKTGTTYLTPTSQPAGKLSVIRSALDVIGDIVELHSEVLGMVPELDRGSHLTRYLDSDDISTCFAATKLVVVLANRGLIRSECREMLLESVVSRLELIQSILHPESHHRLPLADVSLNAALSPKDQDEDALSTHQRVQLEAVHMHLVLSTCALLQTVVVLDASCVSCLCQALETLLIEDFQQISLTNRNIISAERSIIARKAGIESLEILSRVNGEHRATVHFFLSHLESHEMNALRTIVGDAKGAMLDQLMPSHNMSDELVTTPASLARSSLTTMSREEKCRLSETPIESSRYEAMEDSDTVQLEDSGKDDANSRPTLPLDDVIANTPMDEAVESMDTAMQSLAVASVVNQSHIQLVDEMQWIEKQAEESRWKARYELSESDRKRLEKESAARELQFLELEKRFLEAQSHLQFMTEQNFALQNIVEMKSQQMDEMTPLDAEKTAKIEVLGRGLDEAWVKLKVS